MKLGERHEQLVTQYLREVAHCAGAAVSERDRERGLSRLEARIRADITRLRKVEPEDADIEGVLRAIGAPTVQAALLDAPTPDASASRAETDPVWLGVCASVAGKVEFPVRLVRIATFFLGLCTGPLALVVYMAAYAVLRRTQEKEQRDPIDWLTIVWRSAAIFLTIYFLRQGLDYALRGIESAYAQGIERGLPPLGGWGEIRYRAGEYYSTAIMVCVPLAFLSALPLRGGWGKSLFRFSQALVALYAIALSYGVAKFIVGIILDFVRQSAGQIDFSIPGLF